MDNVRHNHELIMVNIISFKKKNNLRPFKKINYVSGRQDQAVILNLRHLSVSTVIFYEMALNKIK